MLMYETLIWRHRNQISRFSQWLHTWASQLIVNYKGVVCEHNIDHKKQSINIYGTSHAMVAECVAHEIGHNLGMEHDFSKVHGGTGKADTSNNPCNGQGFMSYGNHLSQWTSCNVHDFTAQYELNKNNWCMPGNQHIYITISTLSVHRLCNITYVSLRNVL